MAENNYASDLDFLNSHTSIVELDAGNGSRIAVAPQWQGRVMTSTLAGAEGSSFGWLNKDFIASGQTDKSFNNYGGEDRFWMGPEAGQFALWFDKGEPFDLDHWTTPEGFNEGAFAITSQGRSSIAMTRDFTVTNYSGTTFLCAVRRVINALNLPHAAETFGMSIPEDVSAVAFESVNTLANVGQDPWTRQTGMPSVWILGQFKPLPNGKVIIPIVPGPEDQLGPRATLDYFGPLDEDRGKVTEDTVFFTCDGEYRSKIGISPERSKGIIGSYDPDANLLTLVRFTQPDNAADLPYVNSLWEIQDEPFSGDAINSYNDGEPEPGAGQLGPFYEIETSSPAAELGSGEAIGHTHRTCHLSGSFDSLNHISRQVLGVDLSEIG
ncbi:MAG: DUF6786 family protein [Phycisphaerae bacterium]